MTKSDLGKARALAPRAEAFRPRGIGQNNLACFVCDKVKDGYSEIDPVTSKPTGARVISEYDEDGIHYIGGYGSVQPDMASFVSGRVAGERVVRLFKDMGSRALLDFRPSEPEWTQVKVGACDEHLPNLERLRESASEAGGIITPQILSEALEATQQAS